MYVSMREMLQHASVNHYAVPAPNCPDLNMVRAALAAAEAEKSALIIDVSPRQVRMNAIPEAFVPMVEALAEPLNVPVALNLDHGAEFEDICRCIKAGFSSVMCDASSLPFEGKHPPRPAGRGVSRTPTVRSVEAELGHVGQAADGDGRSDDMYTKVDMAVEFVERTGCDALAVAIGTAHGKYPADYVPRARLLVGLAEIKEALGEDYPLVLHGGSGAGDDNFRRAVEGGINKINLWTDYSAAYVCALREYMAENERPDYLLLSVAAEGEGHRVARALHAPLRLFGPLSVRRGQDGGDGLAAMTRFVFACDSFKGTISSARAAKLLEAEARAAFGDVECLGLGVADGGEGTVEAVRGGNRRQPRLGRGRGPARRSRPGHVRPSARRPRAVIEMAAALGDNPRATRGARPAAREHLRHRPARPRRARPRCHRRLARHRWIRHQRRWHGLRPRPGSALPSTPRARSSTAVAPTSSAWPRSTSPGSTRALAPCVSTSCATSTTPWSASAAQPTSLAHRREPPRRRSSASRRVCAPTRPFSSGPSARSSLTRAVWARRAGSAPPLVCSSLLRLSPGVEWVLDLVGLDDDALEGVALCVTGEGHADAQSAHGKVISGVAARCRAAGVPCGPRSSAAWTRTPPSFSAAVSTRSFLRSSTRQSLSDVLAHAEENFVLAARRTFSLLSIGRWLGGERS